MGSKKGKDESVRPESELPPHPTWAAPNPLSYLFLTFVGPLIKRGFSVRLEAEDLRKSDELKSQTLHDNLSKHWEVERKKEKPSIIRALVQGHTGILIFTAILYVISEATNFAGPLLLREIVDALDCRAKAFTDEELANCDSKNRMYMYALGLFVGPCIQSLCQNHMFFLLSKKGVLLRNALMCAVYRKCLALDNGSVQKFSTGKIVTLMSSDCEKVLNIMPMVHQAWGSPIFIAGTMVLLYDVIQWSTFVGLGVMFLVIPFTAKLAMALGQMRRKIVEKTDRRVGLMNEILNGIRIIKFYAWEESFLANISVVRKEEVVLMKRTAMLGAGFGVLMFATPVFTGLAAIGSYALADKELTAAKVYTSLVLFNMLRFPLAFLPMIINMVVQARVSLMRIQEFLLASEVSKDADPASSGDSEIRIDGGEFQWEDEAEEPTLRDVNLRVPRGSLTMVVGPVGSGKSSLLATCINSLTRNKGTVHVGGKVAYVAQTAWILNETVMNNVLFGLPMDRKRYNNAVQVAQLKHDLDMLPFGDQTEIGERGVTLSGGQKQRVSIARAVYADADIVLMDDPLSAVDAHVGSALFEKCIAGALKKKTVVLVTNALQYLPSADQVVVLQEGKLSECGTYESLMAAGVGFSDLMSTHNIQGEDEDDALSNDAGSVRASRDHGSRPNSVSIDGARAGSKSYDRRSQEANRASMDGKKPEANEKNLSGVEDRATGSVSADVWGAYLRAGGGVVLGVSVLITFILEMGSKAATDAWLGLWASDEFDKGKWFYLGVYFGLAVLNALVIGARAINFALGAVRAAASLHRRMLSHVVRLPSAFFDVTPSGRVLNRFSKDTDVIDNTLQGILIQMLACFANIITTLLVISVATPWFLIALVPIFGIYWSVQRYYIPSSRELQRIEAIRRSPIYSHFSESVNGLATIRAYARADHFVWLNDNKCEDDATAMCTQKLAAAWLAMRLDLIGMVTVFLAAFLAVQSGTEAGLAGLSLSYALEITRFLKHGTNMASEAETQMNAVERVNEYTEEGEIATEAAPVTDADAALPKPWPKSGAISVKDLVMRYRPDTPVVLKGLTFDIAAGEKVGICGRTGSGKSSLFLALFRVVEAEGGSITIDGADARFLGLKALRGGMAMIPQDPFMFSGTVRGNIDPFDVYEDTAIWEALGRVGLKEVVEAGGEGLEMKVVDNGNNFSQGQRQLFCMARALLRNAPILMMDEATASVDLDSDVLIQKAVREAFGHCTVLTIAHRLNTIMDSGRVMVMDDGKVAEIGPPKELLAKEGGSFASLVNQTGKKNSEFLKSLTTG